jgi:hypothetical protein
MSLPAFNLESEMKTKTPIHGYDPIKAQVVLTQQEARDILAALRTASHFWPTFRQIVDGGENAFKAIGIDPNLFMPPDRVVEMLLADKICRLNKNIELLTEATDCIAPDISRKIFAENPLNDRKDYCPRCTKTYLHPEALFRDGTPCLLSDNPIWLVPKKGKHGPFLGCVCYPACRFTRSLITQK